ncbi:MAG: hypothetical protein RIS09_1213 [Actinomycetota bacterium]
MNFGEFWQKLLDELTTRGALAGGFTALLFLSILAWWIYWNRRIMKQLDQVDIRILVTGSRGKSSLVRLLHAALSAHGIPTYAKTTGTAAFEIDVESVQHETKRIGQVSILEILEATMRAFSHSTKPKAMVIECMAVSPLLTKILSHQMFQPTMVVITNALLDHLEEQGKTREEIAESLFLAVSSSTKFVVTADPYPSNISVYERLSKENQVQLKLVSSDEAIGVHDEKLAHQHPANIAMALSVGEILGLEKRQTLHGMEQTTVEPFDREFSRIQIQSKTFTFFDLGSINDTDSLPVNINAVLKSSSDRRILLAAVVHRWDRPFRALEFTENLSPNLFDGVLIVGEPYIPAKGILLQNGFADEQILRLNSLSRFNQKWKKHLYQFAQNLNPDSEEVVVVLLENIHDPLAGAIRKELVRGHS